MTGDRTKRIDPATISVGRGELAKGLTGRHIEFIAIGGAIGAGLFLGSGEAIRLAGPSVLFAYILGGLIVYIMTRALGELTLNQPTAPSFIPHIEKFVGPWAGFVTGWSYWLMWVLIGVFEITAASLLFKLWFPVLPQWVTAAAIVSSLFLINRSLVWVFGELEFWLSIIKVLAIIILIVGGFAMAIFHLGPAGHKAMMSNLWVGGGLFPKGLSGFAVSIPIALLAFGSAELIGITAGEADNPARSVPRAINAVIVRILIFYVGSLAAIMVVLPWPAIHAGESPYVQVFSMLGQKGAASIVNFIVITAVVSSCNSGIFATGRMLFSMSRQGDAPTFFGALDYRRLPSRATMASAAALGMGILLNYWIPEQAFEYLQTVLSFFLIWTWMMIVIAHLGFRKSLKRHPLGRTAFPMPLYPFSNIAAILGFALVVCIMIVDPTTRSTFYSAVVWFVGISVVYHARDRLAKSEIPS